MGVVGYKEDEIEKIRMPSVEMHRRGKKDLQLVILADLGMGKLYFLNNTEFCGFFRETMGAEMRRRGKTTSSWSYLLT